MIRLILIACAVLLTVPAFAADPARQAAQQRGTEPPANGVWYVYDRNGALLREENYQSYRLEGDVKTFYPSGSLKEWSVYVDGVRHGPTKTYFQNGGIELEGAYVKNNFEGAVKRYYSTGELESVSSYEKGNLDGERRNYYKSGGIQKVANYKSGVLSGSVLTYNESGLLTLEEKYVNGGLTSRRDLTSESLTSAASAATPPFPKAEPPKGNPLPPGLKDIPKKDMAQPKEPVPAAKP